MLENSILFVGLGTNKYKLNEIVEENNPVEIAKNYGVESVFYEACSTAKIFGAENLFFLNLDAWEDIKDHEDFLKDIGFDYIVPINLKLDELYYDVIYQKNIAYSQLFLLLTHSTISTVIISGKHASDYEDLDDFLDSENNAINSLKPAIENLKKENLIYVANNLEKYKYANIVLAALLSFCDYNEYPQSDQLGKAIFEIDFCDINNNLVFFKNNYLTNTTIENLINFSSNDTIRLVTVNKIIHYFEYHRPNNDRFIGTSYSEYKKVLIAETLQNFLENLVGYIITKYEINSVTDVNTQDCAVDILLNYTIWPKFTTERYIIETSA